MNFEKLERLLKLALILTFLMTIFSTGMTVATISSQNIEGISIWKPIGQALLIMAPIIIAEWFGYRYTHKKAEAIRAERERQEKERLKAERKARAAERRANQPKKKKKK